MELSRARDRVEHVTGDRAALNEQLEAVEPEPAKGREAVLERDRTMDPGHNSSEPRDRGSEPGTEKTRTPKSVDRDLAL